MNELNLNYGTTGKQKTVNIILAAYFTAFGLFVGIREALANIYDVVFICAVVCIVLGVLMLLRNTVWQPAPILKINNDTIETNFPGQRGAKTEWAVVSKVNIGPGYILFMTNGGQKQRKLELSDIKYIDIQKVKSKVIELAEYKNIPYHND